MNNPYGQYRQTSITTASKETVLLMLYEGCIKFLKRAVLAMKNKNIQEKGMYIGKAQDIIFELANSLNHEIGGKISKDLEGLYLFMIEQTTKANFENDPQKLENVIKLLQTLYDGWNGAVDQIKKENKKTA